MSDKDQIKKRDMLILGLCLITSIDTILFGTNANSMMVLVPRITAIIGIVLLGNFRAINKKQLGCLSIILLIVICSLVSNNADLNTGISKVLFILLGFFIATRFSIKEFFIVFDKAMYIISCCAIVLEIVAYLSPALCLHFFKITNTAGAVYYSIGVSSINSVFLNSLIIRSSGIFWEAGAFAVYLIFSLIAQLFIFDETDIKKVLVYLICMFLTFSTTGAIAISALLLTYVFTRESTTTKDKHIKMLIVLVAIVFGALFVFGEQSIVVDSLFGKITNNSSTTRTRVASLIVPFEIAKAYPLLGVSPNRIADCMREYASISSFDLQASAMCTNTLTYQFAAYGFIVGIVFVIRNWLFCRKIALGRTGLAVGLMLSIALSYCGENLYSFLPYVIVFISYRELEGGGNLYDKNCCT